MRKGRGEGGARVANTPAPPVGLGWVVLVGTPDGLQHPVRVNPPQLQGVVHPTRHDLLPQQVKVLPHTQTHHSERVQSSGQRSKVSQRTHGAQDFVAVALHTAEDGHQSVGLDVPQPEGVI